MKTLDKNWLTQGLLDVEYKKYIVLAYLQSIRKAFAQIELYPYFSDLVFHYQNLVEVKENQQLLKENFPKNLSKADFEHLTLEYKKLADDEGFMQCIEEVINYTLPQFKNLLSEGKDIYEWIEENTEITAVGINALHTLEGYLFLKRALAHEEIQVYEYQVSIFESVNEKFRGIHTAYIESIPKTAFETYESIKINLIRKYKKMFNPATYLVYSKVVCPLEPTLLPIAKRMLIRHIS